MTTEQINAEVAAYRRHLVNRQIGVVVAEDTCVPSVRAFGDTCCEFNPFCGVCGRHEEAHRKSGWPLLCPDANPREPGNTAEAGG